MAPTNGINHGSIPNGIAPASDDLVVFACPAAVLPSSSSDTRPLPATIEASLETGRITAVHRQLIPRSAYEGRLASPAEQYHAIEEGCLLFPGLVDAHVHLNEPGRTEWEGFATGTAAAAFGGVTTLVDMPLNAIPPTTTVGNLKAKTDAAQGQCRVDVAFWGGVIPGNQDDLKPLVKAGVRGFKCFLIDSGVDEFPCVGESDLLKAMPNLEEASSLLLFHAEVDCPAAAHSHGHTKDASRSCASDLAPERYTTFLRSRPPTFETAAIEMVIRMNERFPKLRTHIVHLSASEALPMIKEARSRGLPLSIETCYHYLVFSSPTIEDSATQFKCCPPIRSTSNQDALWSALLSGDIDFIVSDHSPCTADLKEGTFMDAWGGIGGLGLGLSLMWTEGRRRRVTGLEGRLAQWMCERPADQIGMRGRKGRIEVGADCDLCVFDPRQSFEVKVDDLKFKNKVSPYLGLKLFGRVRRTVLRGRTIFDGDAPDIALPISGRLLL